MNNFRFSANSLGPSRINLVSASPAPSRTSKAKIGIIIASVLLILLVLSVVGFFLFVPKRSVVTWITTDRPSIDWTFATHKPIEGTTEPQPEPEKEPTDLDILYNEIYLNMDEKIDPCDDFYEYACGLFSRRHPVPEDQREVNYFSLEYDKIRNETIKRLDGEFLKNTDKPSLQYQKRVWDSCVNDKTETGSHLFSLMEYFIELDQLETWQEKFATVTSDGFNVFFTVKAEYFQDRWERFGPGYFFSIDRPELEYSSENVYPVLEYYSEMIRLAKNNISEASSYVDLALEIMEFEKWMSTNATSTSERIKRPWDFNSVLYQSRVNAVSGFYWGEIVKIVANKTLTEENFLVHDMEYLKKFKSIIESKSESFISDYIKMSIVRQSCFMMGRECREIHRRFIEQIDPSKVVDYERQTCFDKLSEQMEDLIYYTYIFDWPRYRGAAWYEMVGKLQKEIKNEVELLSWMDEDTRKRATWRVKNAGFKVKPQMLFMYNIENHAQGIEKKYEPFSNSTGSIDTFDNFNGLNKYKIERVMQSMGLKDESEINPWPVSLFSRTPKLVPIYNDLLVPALVLQGHFFNEKFPPEMRYGLLGSLMGHAMTHSFDSLALKYHRSLGNTFWSEETKNNFDEKMKCLVDAYEKEEMVINGKKYDVKINGNTTLDENLADWMGAVMALQVYRNVSRPPKANYYGPLNNFTKDQMFFLSYANVHCSSDSQQALMDVFLGTHSPRKFRVNVPLKQMPQFSHAFNCKWGSNMNPYEQCHYY